MTQLSAPEAAKAGLFDAPAGPVSDWVQVPLDLEPGVVLLDVAFVDDKHGFLIGTRQTLLETKDGGVTWAKRDISNVNEEGFNYRFNAISFNGQEGWVVGKPAILLHTKNGGESWDRIPLSAKLPGTPVSITAGKTEGTAEMVTDAGAIYVTDNTAYTWKAAVEETVDATLNRTVSSGISGASYYEGSFSGVARSDDGSYIGVSSRGNFYMTWAPGQTYWFPHNRPTTRRVQAMGFLPTGKMWLTTRSGDVLLAKEAGIDCEKWDSAKIGSRGFGVLDIGSQTGDRLFAAGGGGSLFKSEDAGKSWKRDRATDDIPANLYQVHFVNDKLGFVLGNDGILLRSVA